jgi:hypothetical protein
MTAGSSRALSRRAAIVGALGGLGAWLATAISRAAPAEADDGGAVVLGDPNSATHETSISMTPSAGDNYALVAVSHADNGVGVFGSGPNGSAAVGVYGKSHEGTGVQGRVFADTVDSTDSKGVYGNRVLEDPQHTPVLGGAGVYGENIAGDGVHGIGKGGGDGVKGESYTSDGNGVHGFGWNSGTGVNGVGRVGVFGISSENGWMGIWGRHTGNSPGVNGDSNSGAGIHGSSTSGYGGSFEGGKAQLFLKPKSTAGRPTSGTHVKGEIYLDSRGAVFVCVAGGTPGTWRKVATTAA